MNRRISFLEEHYIGCMETGEDHHEYVVLNDIDGNVELCDQLRKTYQEYKKNKGEENEY